MQFFKQLENLCNERGIKLSPLLVEMGFSTGNISKWRNGAIPSGDVLLRFARYFSVPIEYLLVGEEAAAIMSTKNEGDLKMNMGQTRIISIVEVRDALEEVLGDLISVGNETVINQRLVEKYSELTGIKVERLVELCHFLDYLDKGNKVTPDIEKKYPDIDEMIALIKLSNPRPTSHAEALLYRLELEKNGINSNDSNQSLGSAIMDGLTALNKRFDVLERRLAVDSFRGRSSLKKIDQKN